VNPSAFEGDRLRRVVAGRQSADERGNLPGLGIDGHDARAVVLGISCRRADGLVRVRGEESPALEAFLERDVDRRAVRLETSAACGGLGERATNQASARVEDEDVGREG